MHDLLLEWMPNSPEEQRFLHAWTNILTSLFLKQYLSLNLSHQHVCNPYILLSIHSLIFENPHYIWIVQITCTFYNINRSYAKPLSIRSITDINRKITAGFPKVFSFPSHCHWWTWTSGYIIKTSFPVNVISTINIQQISATLVVVINTYNATV